MALVQADLRRMFGSSDTGRRAAERALELDPGLADAHAGLARALFDEGNHQGSLDACLRALAIDANCEQALTQAGYACLALKRPGDAVDYYEAAIVVNHHNLRAVGMVMQAYRDAGQTENAMAAARRVLTLVEGVIAEVPDHVHALGWGVAALATFQDAARTKSWARRALLVSPDNFLLRHNMACSLILVGETDAAFDLLESQIANYSEGLLIWMGRDSDFDSVRQHPRFVKMMAGAHAGLAASKRAEGARA
jgi:adenylate cyclase